MSETEPDLRPIKTLRIQNFQSHENTVLDFETGVNVIVGASDTGKTSIIRALRWLVWNRPLGDDFRSNWGGDTEVVMDLDNCIIERFKGKNDHYKLWNDPDEPEIEFNAFGKSVPDEIQRALNFSEINVQNQHDSAFLISNNPGEVSRHFNRIANIDQIDSSLRNVEGWIRGIRQDIKSTEGEIERYQEKLEEFEYLDKLEARVEVLEDLKDRKISKANKARKIKKLIEDIESVSKKITEHSEILPAGGEVRHLIKQNKARKKRIKKYKKLKKLAKKIQHVSAQLSKARTKTDGKDLLDSVLQLYNEKEEREQQAEDLDSLMTEIVNISKQLDNAEAKLDELEEEWHEVAPDTCPLCGSEMG